MERDRRGDTGPESRPLLQTLVQHGRRVLPRGWAPLVQLAARALPGLQRYRASLIDGDHLYLDLRQSMCLGYFFYGCLPHEAGTARLIRRVATEGGVVVDVGANVGYFTRIASRAVGSTGVVHAVEPLASALRLLRLNTQDLPNVFIHATALSARSGEASLYVHEGGDLSTLSPSDDAREVVRVPLTTLDELLADASRVDLIKIDVEGHEFEVVMGAMRTLQKFRPVVYFELLQGYSSRSGYGFDEFRTLLEPHGYSLAWIDHKDKNTRLLSDLPSTYVVAVPQSRRAELGRD